MNVTRKYIENFSRKLLNLKNPPVLWSSIRIDGNCFFHAIDYAITGKLLPKDSNKVIELRQNIVSTMKGEISGVPYEEFMNARRNGKKIPWPYAEIDVIMATSKYYQRPIIVISMNNYGGVTMIRPKNVKLNDPLFLICESTIHYVPFHSNKVKITESMRNTLIQIEKNKMSNGAIQDENGVYVTTCLLKDIYKEKYSDLLNSLNITRKRLGRKSSKTKSFKSSSKYKTNGISPKLQKEDASLSKRMQQINANYQMAKAMQL